jgi:homoserine O-acetyltransferase/O-succinyltransferase
MEAQTHYFTLADETTGPLTLRSGEVLPEARLAYETYGALNGDRDNAVLVFHALSGSQHAAGWNASVPGVEDLWTAECKTGWWDGFIGPGKAIDTDRYFVVCANYLGGCYGSTGPSSIDPRRGAPYGGRFPAVSLGDIVESQVRLLAHLGIDQLHAATGGSLGGMLALQLATAHPAFVRKVIPIACGLGVTTLQRLHNFEQIFAIDQDHFFHQGDYYGRQPPTKGLTLARIISQKTFISLETIARRSKNEIIQHEDDLKSYQLTDVVESYMLHQGRKFVQRFDANTYLRILEAWQAYDLLRDRGAEDFPELFSRCRKQEYLVFSIDSDVCFYPEEQERLVDEIRACRIPCEWAPVHSEKGHDSFLIEPELYTETLSGFLARD